MQRDQETRLPQKGYSGVPFLFLLTTLVAGFIVFGQAHTLIGQELSHSRVARSVRPVTPKVRSQALANFDNLPLSFEPNQGQVDPAVEYMAHGSQYTLFLTTSETVFALPERVQESTVVDPKPGKPDTRTGQVRSPSSWATIRMRLVGADPEARLLANDELPGRKNYYRGRDKTKWVTGVPLYSKVDAQDVYPGVDVAYRSAGNQCEFDFVVGPGADPKQIKLAFQGASQMKIDSSGDLVLSSAGGDLRFHHPLAYQEESNGKRDPVSVHFVQHRDHQVSLALGPYDSQRQLVIDPSVTYATYLGGSGQDEGLGVATDGAGNTFVTGATNSPDFVVTNGFYTGGFDVFVTEFDPNGQLIFSTLVGGSADDIGTSIAFDLAGSTAYVTGSTTSFDFPVIYGQSYQFYLAGIQNAFVLELTVQCPDLCGTFAASTYLGGEAVDTGLAITFDGQGNAYVAGQTTSQSFPSWFPLFNETQINLGDGSGAADGFVTELAPGLTVPIFSTFLGGGSQDFATGIAIDNPDSGTNAFNIYVSGGTVSPDFYTTPGVIQPTCGTDGHCNNGQDDAFVAVICNYIAPPCNSDGLTPLYVYSTYLGGNGKDDALSIAADSDSNAYITGQTLSTDFKLQSPLQGALKGAQNAFVSKLNPTGTALTFSTYLGGSGTDAGLGIAIDSNENVYLTGRTNSPDFPVQYPTQGTIGGGNDAFISALDSSGSRLIFSTFLGGSGDEDLIGGSIAVDSAQNVYVTGDTNSANFPVQSAFQSTFAGSGNCTINGNQVPCPDAFVARVNAQPPGTSTLTITFGTGDGKGLVTSDPSGIDCETTGTPGDCSASFTDGTVVTLTETAFDAAFNGWGGAGSSCGNNSTCQITISSDETVTADFISAPTYTLSVQGQGQGSASGTGTVTSVPSGIDCGPTCSFNFIGSQPITLTATPSPGSYFAGWSGGLCSGTGACVVTLSSNLTVGYTFALTNGPPPPQADFSLNASPASLGTITAGSAGVAGVALIGLNGFDDTVSLSCSVQPSSASSPTCTLSPSTVSIPLNGGGSATLTINTSGLTASRTPGPAHGSKGALLAFCGPFLSISLLGAGTNLRASNWRRYVIRFMFGMVLAGVASFPIACNGRGGSGSGVPGGVAQPGNYIVTITGTAMSTPTTHTTQLTLTVQ